MKRGVARVCARLTGRCLRWGREHKKQDISPDNGVVSRHGAGRLKEHWCFVTCCKTSCSNCYSRLVDYRGMFGSLNGDRFVRPSKCGLQLALMFGWAEHQEEKTASEIISSPAYIFFFRQEQICSINAVVGCTRLAGCFKWTFLINNKQGGPDKNSILYWSSFKHFSDLF